MIVKTDGLFAALVSSIVNVTSLGSGLQLLATTRHWGIAKHEPLYNCTGLYLALHLRNSRTKCSSEIFYEIIEKLTIPLSWVVA